MIDRGKADVNDIRGIVTFIVTRKLTHTHTHAHTHTHTNVHTHTHTYTHSHTVITHTY